MRFQIRRIAFCKRLSSCIVILLMFTVTYLEVFEYYFVSWHRLKCEKETDCVRILLVADPQLIGLRNEVIHWLTPLAIWDSDRFLQKTYGIAKKFVNPHIVIFLGDLMDEGSIATKVEFQLYVERFEHVFKCQKDFEKQYLFIPGDNDVGGEGMEPLKPSRLQRFEQTYRTKDVVHTNNLTFFKVNRFIQSIPALKNGKSLDVEDSDEIRITLSHMPIVFSPSVFSEKVLSTVRPNLLFAAHEHSSMIVTSDSIVQVRQVEPVNPEDADIHRLYLKLGNIFEIIVPTCSYRMGTPKIGYGYALIENNEVQYTVLWSPSRLRQLFVYVVVLFASFWLAICSKCRRNAK